MLLKSLPMLAAVMVGGHSMPDSTAVIDLEAITVSARVASTQNSSLRLTDISKDQILLTAPGRTFVELIRGVPGIYSSAETGSYGDAKINIRGFKQENISVLLNGIPISGLTSGSMYWNNWMGLADATASIQIQKGIGNSMLSDNSVGGTISIITTQPAEKASAEVGYYHTGYGTNNAFLSLNSGMLRKGWAFSLMGSYTWGSSWVEATDLSTWSYQAVVSKRINSRNSLNLTALGSPEQHEQRSQRLTYAEVEKYGRAYSKNWGYYREEDGTLTKRTLSRNTYHKPYITLTHSYDGRTHDSSEVGLRIITSLYAAFANGGGFYTESKGRRIAQFMGSEGSVNEGHIDWNAVYDYNRSGAFTDDHGHASQNIMSDYLAGHVQTGLKSSFIYDFSERLSVDAGLHWQMYKTWEKEQITDLLGGDYWYEDYAGKSLMGQAGRNSYKKVGDFIRTENGRDQHYGTLYSIASYKAGSQMNTILTFGISASGTMLRRWDLYNYSDSDKFSNWASRAGGSIKAGVLHKASRTSSIYANMAAYSRAPYASVFFSNGNNEISRNITNEKNYLAEAGYRAVGEKFTLETTIYGAFWQDKTLMSSAYKSLDEDPVKYMVKGLDALHFGVEADASYRIAKDVRLDAFASLGQWKWKNDVSATVYDPYSMKPLQEVKVYSDGLHVGDAPQTQIGASVHAGFLRDFAAFAEWSYNDRFWADFDPVSRTREDDRSDAFRLPSYNLVNLGASWNHSFGHYKLSLFVNLNNVLDACYVERSKDGGAHDQSSFTGYWANGRNLNFGLRIRR